MGYSVKARTNFDETYYKHFYLDPVTRALNPEAFVSLSQFVMSYLEYLDVEISSVLDIGCGLGQWQGVITKALPTASYLGVETSLHACQKYGWVQGSVVDFQSDPADFVICSDVLQYLDDRAAIRAINNLNHLCTGALYFAVLTQSDWLHHCDQERSDDQAHLRSGDWYRKLLSEFFWNAGGGLFISKKSEVILFDLEQI